VKEVLLGSRESSRRYGIGTSLRRKQILPMDIEAQLELEMHIDPLAQFCDGFY
jgi:hypothetical protein